MATDKIIVQIEEMVKNMFKKEYNVYEVLAKIIPSIDIKYKNFLQLIPKLKQIGIELEAEGIVSQLQNLVEAIDKRDMVRLYDSLNFEIKETLVLYREIEMIMEQ